MAKTKKSQTTAKTEEKQSIKQERYSVSKAADNTINIKIVIPWHEVEKVRKEVSNELVKEVQVPGFRKGKAPRDIAEVKLSKEKVNEEVLKKVLTKEYVEAVKANNIQPILNPKIHIEAFDEGTNLEFMAETCEEPVVELNSYKDEVKKVNAASKIIVPPSASSGQANQEPKKISLEEILETVLKVTKITIPKVLAEQEANRLLSQLLDELKTIGVSLDQFLASRGKTGDEIRAEYMEKAEKDLKLEFLLRKIADSEKITVEEKDIQEALASITDEKQKKELMANPYFLAAIIRQQKTIDFLSKI